VVGPVGGNSNIVAQTETETAAELGFGLNSYIPAKTNMECAAKG